MSNIQVFETSEITKKERTILTGFPGMGFIGNTALMHVVKSLGFKQVGYVHGNIMPPLMVLMDGIPNHSFRIYSDPSDDFLFLITEATISGRSAWEIGSELMKWIKNKGFTEIITIEGFSFANPGNDVFGFSNSLMNLEEFGIKPINQAVISGVNAALLKNALSDNIPWTTILIPTPVVRGIDYRGAVSAVQILNRICKLNVNTKHLEQLSNAVTAVTKTRQT